MNRPLTAAGTFLAVAAALVLGACGSSNNTTTSSGGTAPTATPAPAGGNSGSSFCLQGAAAVAQLSHISAGFASTTPGATPDVASIKQLFATADSGVDALDSSAPSEISAAFHTLRAAYDQANSQVQAATSLEQLSAAVDGLSSASISSADDQITNYMKNTCGITPSP